MKRITLKTTPPDWMLARDGLTVRLLARDEFTVRQFKARKRRELKALIAAFKVYRMGCAYTPNNSGEIESIQTALDQLQKNISVKEWGR